MKLTCYLTGAEKPKLRPAPAKRPWMDAISNAFAYRCLPLTIANAYGWQLLCPAAFSVMWRGEAHSDLDAIDIRPAEGEGRADLPISHFGSGIITFQIQGLFQTDPGVNLFVGGPVNAPKDGITPLSGIVETDWSPFTFTMNWQITRPGVRIHFEKGEPVCQIFPIQPQLVEKMTPAFAPMSDDSDLATRYGAWAASRAGFIQALIDREPEAVDQKWQKFYHRGTDTDGDSGEQRHRTKMTLRPFAEP